MLSVGSQIIVVAKYPYTMGCLFILQPMLPIARAELSMVWLTTVQDRAYRTAPSLGSDVITFAVADWWARHYPLGYGGLLWKGRGKICVRRSFLRPNRRFFLPSNALRYRHNDIIRGKQKHIGPLDASSLSYGPHAAYQLPRNWYTYHNIIMERCGVCVYRIIPRRCEERAALSYTRTHTHAPVTRWRTHAQTRGTYHIYYPTVRLLLGIGGTARAHTTVASEIMGVAVVGITAVL